MRGAQKLKEDHLKMPFLLFWWQQKIIILTKFPVCDP